VQLEDSTRQIVVSIAPSAGNLTREMTVKGHNILGPQGIPFLAPWANRLDEQAFYANGKRYAFDMQLGNVRGERPIHGFSPRRSGRSSRPKADAASAWVTSRLEFFKAAGLDGAVSVRTHHQHHAPPERRRAGRRRRACAISAPSRCRWPSVFTRTSGSTMRRAMRGRSASARRPNGCSRRRRSRPARLADRTALPDPRAAVLREHDLDHVFADLTRDSSGLATMSLAGTAQRIDVLFGAAYRAAVIYAPKGRDFICFEPMAGITDSMNLAQRGPCTRTCSTWRLERRGRNTSSSARADSDGRRAAVHRFLCGLGGLCVLRVVCRRAGNARPGPAGRL
jgi:aldose 1-epimerase